MLNLILGTSGVSKTKYLYDMMSELALNGNDKLMFIVPDQSSFETEKAFLDMLGPKICSNIKVFGFSRLSDYVFEQTGNKFKAFADDGICNVVMNLAIEQVEDKLELFKKRSTSADLTELMLNSVKEYKKCSITTEMLYEASKNIQDEALSKKLYETALVYDTYDAIIKNSYIDPSDRLTRVTDILRDTKLFDDYTIAVDSYYGFTKQEYELISVLMKSTRDMYFALTTDDCGDTDTDLFFVTNRTKKRLMHIAKDNGIKTAKPIVLTNNHRTNSPELTFINNNIFRTDKEPMIRTDGDITVFEASGIYSETDFAARTIKRLIAEEHYQYRDIAIITRSIDKYAGVLDAALDKYGISYFMDIPQDILSKPLFKFVSSCFDFITGGFDKDDLLSILKTGLTDVTVEQIADFENYLFTWDISGKRLLQEFKANPRGFSNEFKESDKLLLSQIEATRSTVVGALSDFYYATKDTTGLSISKALMTLIYKLNCRENILSMCDRLEAEGEIELSKEQVRLYNTLVEILDKMVSVIGDYHISAKRFSELLVINFANTNLSFIPRGIDQVDVACADRSTLDEKKAVFIIGAVDGEFPHTPVQSGVFSDIEKQLLKDVSIVMSDSIDQLIMTEKYLAYMALCSASEKLYISYSTCTLTGEKTSPSSIISEVKRCVDIPVANDSYVPNCDKVWSEQTAFELFSKKYNSYRPDICGLGEYFRQAEGYKDIVSAIDNAHNKQPMQISNADNAKKLFGTNMFLSASQVENYHMCRFGYFCNYGLKVRQRRKAEIDALEYGTLIHHILEYFIKNHKNDDFKAITHDMVSAEVSQILDDYLESYLGGRDGKSQRFLYLFYSMKLTAIALIKHICEELAQSKFKPVDFELSISEDVPAYSIKIADDVTVKIRGSVDRVDIMNRNGTKYLRVVDYKTGIKHYKISDILYGINLQMLIYMSAITSGGESRYGSAITPAGVLYMPAVSPTISDATGLTDDQISKEKSKKYTMFGIVLDDMEIVKGMDEDVSERYISIKKVGNKKSSVELATLEEFGKLFSKVDELITLMAESLLSGDIGAVPAKEQYDACEYCGYKAICGYKDGDECRQIQGKSKEATMLEIENGEGTPNG